MQDLNELKLAFIKLIQYTFLPHQLSLMKQLFYSEIQREREEREERFWKIVMFSYCKNMAYPTDRSSTWNSSAPLQNKVKQLKYVYNRHILTWVSHCFVM